MSWSNDIVRVGTTWTAWKVGERMGLLEDLSTVFNKETAQTLLALTIYKLDGGRAIMNLQVVKRSLKAQKRSRHFS